MKFVLKPAGVLVFLLVLTGLLLAAHIASQVFLFHLGWEFRNFWLIKLFDFGRETNIPTLYTTLLLLVSSLLCGLLSRAGKDNGSPDRWYWGVLCILLLFVGIDETAMIHEAMIKPLRAHLGASGVFYYAWVIPYGILLLVVALTFLRFVLSLPARIKTLIFVGAGVYITGVLVFEMFGAMYADTHSSRTETYAVIAAFEETLEMTGLSVFIFALLSYLSHTKTDIHVSMTRGG